MTSPDKKMCLSPTFVSGPNCELKKEKEKYGS